MCEKIQAQLLDESASPLGAEAREHIAGCEQCRAVEVEARMTAGALASVVQDADSRARISLPSELRGRVYQAARNKLAESSSAATATARTAKETKPAKSGESGLIEKLVAFVSPRSFVWAGAAVVVLALVFGVGSSVQRSRPAGEVAFARGAFDATRDSSDVTLAVGQGETLRRRTSVRTSADSGALLVMGRKKSVALAIAGSTSLRLVDPRHIDLRSGSVWLGVEPGGKGFEVSTPHGVVRVTGTSFGVAVGEAGIEVEVAEGTVEVGEEGEVTSVHARQALRVDSEGGEFVVSRSDGRALPEWVVALDREARLAAVSSFIPSIGEAKAK